MVCSLGLGGASPACCESGVTAGEPLTMRPLSGPRGDVAALILSGRDGGPLRVAALAVPECPGAPTALWVEIEAGSLLAAVASGDEYALPESTRVELYAYAMTREGEIAASLAQWVRLPIVDLTGRLPGGGVKLAASLELPPGEYQIRTLVREPRSQQFALRVLGVGVPGVETPRPFPTPPLFTDPVEGWLQVRPSAGGDGSAEAPAALPVLAADVPRAFSLRGCNLAGASLDARLVDPAGQPQRGAEIHFERVAGEDGPVTGQVRPAGLAPGLYRLEVTATNGAGESSVALPVFVTTADAAPAKPVAWTALGGLTERAEAPRAGLDGLDGTRSGRRVDAIAAAYRQVLERLASGRRDEAVTQLVALQSEVSDASDKEKRALNQLDEAEDRVARELFDRDPECLLPLLLLHLDLQDRYLGMKPVDSGLLQATRSRVRTLAQVYAAKAKSEMAPALGAMVLVELADALERAQQRVSALIVLREAIGLDPANPDVLLHLAYQYENHGFDAEALALLERLLEIEPHSDEGRLRLAMNMQRAGRHADAARVLDRLVRDATTDWVLAVAYEELGRSLLREQRTDDAVRLLRQGVRRLPGVQRLYVELAYALDRGGQRRAGREVVAAMPRDDGRPSPRLLYRVVPDDAGSRSRDALVRHATARLPLLAQALTSTEAGR
jgi:tetratricopeptide (TPR) repeat protein